MAYGEKRGYDKKMRKWRYRGRYLLPDGINYGSVSRDDNGQPFYTKKSAEDYAAGLEVDVRRKTFINPRDGRITVGEWAELWIKSVELANRSDKTYQQRLRSVILPRWEAAAMGDVAEVAVKTWEKELRERYKPRYVKSVMSVMRVMFDDAVSSKVRADNPVPTLKSRRRGKYKGKQQHDEVVIATPRQALLLARNARAMRGLVGYAQVLMIAYCGLRISELVGLRREHLVLEDHGRGCRVLVQKQHQYVDGKPGQVDPKYGSSGDLILPPFLAELLREVLASHKSEWVFPAAKGGKQNTTSFYGEVWRRWVDGHEAVPDSLGRPSRLPDMKAVAGIEGLVPHGLRHSMKVWLDELRHPRVAVEERMRHVIGGVEGTYSHTTLAMELDIAADLQKLWETAVGVVDHPREWEEPRNHWEREPRRKLISPDSPNLVNQDHDGSAAA
ncbi:tyrosine-type recombinase/integrase [Streptomyces sp. NPDC005799]|uniref:tyrosine-type recombinase/integrase n=1 Tax=Streptomyces sp. NPDC005799 TaxID=3154678 RepID=UPI0033C76544